MQTNFVVASFSPDPSGASAMGFSAALYAAVIGVAALLL